MFKGFSDATTDFLWNVRFNNERPWFEAHKQEYLDHLWTPFKELANEVYDLFNEEFEDLMLDLHISRIYRDARRLHGRGPYKDNLWFSIRRNSDYWHEHPVFWFEVAPEGYKYGLGIYSPKPDLMARFRKELDAGSPQFIELAEAFEQQDRFIIDGGEYVRKKGNPEPPLDRWYNRKSVDILCDRGLAKNFYSNKLTRELVEGFSMLAPYYKYFDGLAHRLKSEAESAEDEF